jgi:hypothetical protein
MNLRGSRKYGKFLVQLSDYQFLKKDSADGASRSE